MRLNLVGMANTDNRTHKWFNLYFSLSNFPGKIGFSSYDDSRSMGQFFCANLNGPIEDICPSRRPIIENFSEISLSLLKPKQTKNKIVNKQRKEYFSNGV